ncbi:uncharacterized protein BXZ73DRAFT_102269 [Epithele typhae]|uniref:uncharacterized protein n=1 Tax=Epithele typhae TaxID=378194 RepID=UPI002008CBC2|nr:uncharacterized protein BXZ73DRAFT_102269 [Epithele typhae]KAH9929121.1 hypothetical protein BXZ73DRAFT_102269 [Epithele typhae]
MSVLKEIAEAGGDQLADLKLVKYGIVVAATWTWAEICANMEEEITYIWPSRISFMKVLYFHNRYSPVVDTAFALASSLSNVGNHKLCTAEFQVMAFSYTSGTFASEFILIARTLALYNFHPFMIALACALVLITVVPTAATSIRILFPLAYPGDDVIKITGCVPSVDNISSAWVFFICLLVSETIIVSLTFFRQWETAEEREGLLQRLFRWGKRGMQTGPTLSMPRSHRSPLVKTMYRNSSIYYVIMLILSTINLAMTATNNPALRPVLQMPLRTVHASLCTRVLLNLRRVAAQAASPTMPDFTIATLSGIAFRDPNAEGRTRLEGLEEHPYGRERGGGENTVYIELELEALSSRGRSSLSQEILLQPSALRTKSAPARCTGTTSHQLDAGLYLVSSYIFAPGSTDLKLVATRPTKASDKLTIGLMTSSARSNQESAGVARSTPPYDVMDGGVDYTKGADDQCSNIFDPQLLSDLLSSPILTHLGWSVHVELAFDDKRPVFSPAPANESPLLAVPFTDNKDRYTELPGLLALHVNRGGYEGHCAHLARWGAHLPRLQQSPRLAEFIAPSSEP